MGLRENCVVGRGFSVVKTWWDAWWMWSFSTTLFGFEKYANFLRFIFWVAWWGLGCYRCQIRVGRRLRIRQVGQPSFVIADFRELGSMKLPYCRQCGPGCFISGAAEGATCFLVSRPQVRFLVAIFIFDGEHAGRAASSHSRSCRASAIAGRSLTSSPGSVDALSGDGVFRVGGIL